MSYNKKTMIKTFSKLITILIFGMLIASCAKEPGVIIPEDIKGFWKLQNDVQFKGLAFTNLEFDGDNCSACIDPVINDSIYLYDRFSVKHDSLCLVDVNGKESTYRIHELHDSVLVLTNFQGADQDLVFKRVVYTKNNSRIYAKDMPADSLDINFKNPRYLIKDNKYFVLSEKDVKKAHDILKDYMDSYVEKKPYRDFEKIISSDGKVSNENFSEEHLEFLDSVYMPLPFNNYFRQYLGYREDGHLNVEIILICESLSSPFPYTKLKREFYFVNDGGKCFGHAIINLTEGKVIRFYING